MDEQEEVLNYNKGEGRNILIELKRKCGSYVEAVDNICSENALAQKELDKPNIHRLLELYNHTIPLMGHIRHGQELLFEAAHQPLKRSLKQSSKGNPLLTAIDEMLANDWKSRIGTALLEYGINESSKLSDTQCMKLKQMLCGEECQADVEDGKEIASRVRKCFKPPVMEELLSFPQAEHSMDLRQCRPAEDKEMRCTQVCEITDTTKAVSYISEIYNVHLNGSSSLRKMKFAKSIHTLLYQTRNFSERTTTKKKSFHIIGRCDVIQAAVRYPPGNSSSDARPVQILCTQDDTINCMTAPSCTRMFWLVLDIIPMTAKTVTNNSEHQDVRMMVAVWPVNIDETVQHPICEFYSVHRVLEKDVLYIIPLSESVVKVMVLHICNWNTNTECRLTPQTTKCVHHGGIGDGEPYILFGRKEGFPPQRG